MVNKNDAIIHAAVFHISNLCAMTFIAAENGLCQRPRRTNENLVLPLHSCRVPAILSSSYTTTTTTTGCVWHASRPLWRLRLSSARELTWPILDRRRRSPTNTKLASCIAHSGLQRDPKKSTT